MAKRKATVAVRGKADLLPLPRVEVDRIGLEYHLALEVIRAGAGDARMLKILTDVLIVVHFLREQGFGGGQENSAVFSAAQDVLNACDGHAVRAGVWKLTGASAAVVGRLLCLHDRQLRLSPRAAVVEAVRRRDAYWATRTPPVQQPTPLRRAA